MSTLAAGGDLAGYSGTPLVRKLGIKAGHRVGLVTAPSGFEEQLVGLPDGVALRRGLRGKAAFDVLLFFVTRRVKLEGEFARLAARLETNGGLWVCWPKKASGKPTDVTENEVRGTGLDRGLVDNKICAVDEIWSGLRFVYRLRDRPKKT